MASQSLYRKWRSQTFSELVGQEKIVQTLKNALSSGNVRHAYLFTGPRGTGKTSTARLLAKTINCPNVKNGEPCNTCSQCREITAGTSFNVIEIDAASNRGIDSIRELREKVMMPPTTGKFKVYILDEAHMLTNEAFNALLKTLEEPPPHAVFVMATTDVHKMLPTVLSRCQQFNFKRISTRQIVEHLNFVAQQEQVRLDRGAAELIARAATGGMRDALSLLDQAIAYCGQEIALSQIQAMLGVADPRAIHNLVQQVAALDSSVGLHLIHELAEAGADLRQINTQVADYWRAVMLVKAGADIAAILDNTEDEVREISSCAQLFALEELTECARIFAQNELMQKGQGTPQLGLELAFLACVELHRRAQSGQSLAAPRPAANAIQPNPRPTSVQQPATRPAAAPTSSVSPPPATTRPEPAAAVEPPKPAPVAAPEPVKPVTPAVYEEEAPEWDQISYQEEEALAPSPAAPPVDARPALLRASAPVEPEKAAAPMAPAFHAPTLTVQQVKESWEVIKKRVKAKPGNIKESSTVSALLVDFSPVAVEGTAERTVLVLQAGHDFQYGKMGEKDRVTLLQWALKLEFNQECQIKLLSPGQAYAPPPQHQMTSMPEAASRSAHSIVAPQRQPARREPPPIEEPPTNISSFEAKAAQRAQQNKPSTPSHSTDESAPPLARNHVVRENTGKTPETTPSPSPDGESRQTQVDKKAKSDPVVKEVVRIFKADIKAVQLK